MEKHEDASLPNGKPKFAPRASHVDVTQREQEKANSQQLQEKGPQGGGPNTLPSQADGATPK
ncbi:MAG: hypothetical protein ITG01_04455 [Comamonas sp.]|jgi:hypothetical protein|nr:hypothetical protein [Comamonas sp.]